MAEPTIVLPTKKVSGSIKAAGLNVGGIMTEVPLNSSTWTALPATPRPGRNAMSVQNQSTIEVKYNYVNNVGYVGEIIDKNNGAVQLDISDDILIFGRSASGTPTVLVNEIE